MKKIYIAGPDIFERDSIEIGKRYIELCSKYGFEGFYPFNNLIDSKENKKQAAQDIYQANKKLIDECDIIIANINSFRGKESSSGTVWECGYASAIGKEIYAYLFRPTTYVQQFIETEKLGHKDGFCDLQGRIIENFDYPVNLMLACSIKEIVVGGFEDVLKKISSK